MTRHESTTGARIIAGPDGALLGVYLNDHLAGATLGTQLAARLAAAHRTSPDAEVFERLAMEIAEDRATLIGLMETLGVPIRRYKVALAWVAEKAGRIKPNGRLFERSPLSSLEEIEMMRLGVEGKSACWRTLQVMADRDDRLGRKRLDELLSRADRQAETLEELRVRASAELAGVF